MQHAILRVGITLTERMGASWLRCSDQIVEFIDNEHIKPAQDGLEDANLLALEPDCEHEIHRDRSCATILGCLPKKKCQIAGVGSEYALRLRDHEKGAHRRAFKSTSLCAKCLW